MRGRSREGRSREERGREGRGREGQSDEERVREGRVREERVRERLRPAAGLRRCFGSSRGFFFSSFLAQTSLLPV